MAYFDHIRMRMQEKNGSGEHLAISFEPAEENS